MTASEGSSQPNVLWVMADQHSAKCTSWGRFPTEVQTPGLDRLAGEGVRFDRAVTQNPICTPSRTSYLTGQYPSNHGVYGLTSDGGSVDAATLFSALARRGYRTGAFGKIHTPEGLVEPALDELWDAGGSNGPDRYEEYLRGRELLADRDDRYLQEWRERHGTASGQGLDARPSRLSYEDQVESVTVDRAATFVEEAAADGAPFCAWVTLHRPHQVYAPGEQFWGLYDDVDLPPSAFEDLSDKPPHQTNLNPDETTEHAVFEPRTQEAFLRRKLRGYLGCVSMVDDCLNRLLDVLERAGVREDTIVVYCSDHGEFAAEHGFPEKAPGISYDAVTRVPFVWSWPGQFREGAVVEELAETVDFLPTLLSLVDGSDVPAADGVDLSGLLTGADAGPVREYAVTENAWTRTVRTEDQKLTVYPAGFFGEDSEESLEFYDLREDPWETENLAVADDPPTEAIQRHLGYLREFLQTRRRPTSTLSVGRTTGESADGTVSPAAIADHLERNRGDDYL